MLLRKLTISTGGGSSDVFVELSAPEQEQLDAWSCSYSIGWPGRPKVGTGWGVDGIQALQLTLQIVGAQLYASQYHEAGSLVWERAGDGYGFPVPATIRDLLVGSDRAQFTATE